MTRRTLRPRLVIYSLVGEDGRDLYEAELHDRDGGAACIGTASNHIELIALLAAFLATGLIPELEGPDGGRDLPYSFADKVAQEYRHSRHGRGRRAA